MHKFAAGHRYLSYLRPNSDEQRELLRHLTHAPGVDTGAIVGKSKANGQFMIFEYGDYSSHPEGFLFAENLKRKGISRAPLRPLHEPAVIAQTDEPRGLDWHDVEGSARRYRWSGPNPRPKILIPYTGRRAHIAIEVVHGNPALRLEDVSLRVEDSPVACKVETGRAGAFYLIADIWLQRDDYTVLTLHAPTFCGQGEDRRKRGLAVGEILIEPIKSRWRAIGWSSIRERLPF